MGTKFFDEYGGEEIFSVENRAIMLQIGSDVKVHKTSNVVNYRVESQGFSYGGDFDYIFYYLKKI